MGRSFCSSDAGKVGKMSKCLEVFKDGGQWMSSSSYRVIVVPASRQNKIWVPHLGRTKFESPKVPNMLQKAVCT
jgi:hypothetical protein